MQGMHRRRLVFRLVIVFLRRGGGGSGVSCRARCIHAGGLGGAHRAASSGGSYCSGGYCGRYGPRLQRMRRRLGRGPERIVLPDQPCQLRKRIALGRAVGITAIMVGGGKRSVLISISHRDDASPSGQRQPAMSTNHDERIGPCQIPHEPPSVRAFAPAYRISVGAWTPRTAKPDARTETTPCTIARRALVISASLVIMKRK